jgi:proteasome accessory factor B
MTEPLERVTNLLALLLESEPLTLRQIVGRLHGQYPEGESAQRTAFERDKALLRDVGVPIDTEVGIAHQAGQTLYSIDRSRYELPELDLTDDERQALQLAVAASRHHDAQFALFKLGGAAQTAAVHAELPHHDSLPLLHDAIASRRTVAFAYRARQRQLDPYTLLLREGRWYLVGFDHGHNEARTYRVDRIEGAITAGDGDAFQRPAGFDVRSVFPEDPKEIGDGEAFADVMVDGSLQRVPCANADAFRAWLFGFGDRAEVIGPPEVREATISWLMSAAS